MGKRLYDMCEIVFGTGLAESISTEIQHAFAILNNILADPVYSKFINALMGIGALLMMLYFFQSMIDQASRDMFSFEKLIVAFIKMIVAFTVMIYLPELLQLVLKLGGAFVDFVNESFSPVSGEALESTEKLRESYNTYFRATKFIEACGCMIGLLVPWLISMFCELLSKFIVYSNGIMLGVRMVFSPVAVAQLFEDGSRSSGIRFLKGLFADALGFSIVLLIVLVANAFAGGGTNAIPNPEDLQDGLGWAGMVNATLAKLVIAGGMAGASKIAHDVMGA